MPPIVEGECGRDDVLLVSALGTDTAVALERPALLSCGMAAALARWIGESVQPAARRHLGTQVSRLPPGTSYACRTRNNRPGARLSEHAYANAYDLMGFHFANGDALLVSQHDGNEPADRFLTEIRKAACGAFDTVLGPGSDEHHHDHFHFDAHERRTPYCR